MSNTGTYTLEELLAYNFVPASEFGFDNVTKAIQARIDYLNAEIANQMADFAEQTSDSRRVWGTSEDAKMSEMDEFGAPHSVVQTSGVEVDFPMRKFSVKTGWTTDFLRKATPADLAKKALLMQEAYLATIKDEIAFAIFNDDNYTFKDYLEDNTSLSVKAFLNADSSTIPNAPDGTTFAGASHTHYNGTVGASLAEADITALITNVREHGLKGLALFVNAADVSVIDALGSVFVPLTHAVLAVSGATSGTVVTDDPANYDLNNRLAGYWDGVPVYTKPWVVDNYIVCIALGASEKPLVYRVDKNSALRGLIMGNEYGTDVITAKTADAYFGFGAWNRAAVAVLDTATQTTYTEPTLVR